MPFVVLPALIPDISDVYSTYFAAFADDPLTRALFPSATPEDLKNPESAFRKAHTSHVLSYWHTSRTQYTLKCISVSPTSPSTPRVVGMALLDVYPTASDWKPEPIGWLTGSELERAEALITPLTSARERLWSNERYVYCHVVAVDPEFQRQGVGKLLMEEGLRIARQAGLPIYLESSRDAVRLYEGLGFRRIKGEKVVHSAEVVGEGKDDYEVPLMVWVPEGAESAVPKRVQLE